MLTKDELPKNPVITCLNTFANKWKLWIMWNLHNTPKLRFSEIMQNIPRHLEKSFNGQFTRARSGRDNTSRIFCRWISAESRIHAFRYRKFASPNNYSNERMGRKL